MIWLLQDIRMELRHMNDNSLERKACNWLLLSCLLSSAHLIVLDWDWTQYEPTQGNDQDSIHWESWFLFALAILFFGGPEFQKRVQIFLPKILALAHARPTHWLELVSFSKLGKCCRGYTQISSRFPCCEILLFLDGNRHDCFPSLIAYLCVAIMKYNISCQTLI